MNYDVFPCALWSEKEYDPVVTFNFSGYTNNTAGVYSSISVGTFSPDSEALLLKQTSMDNSDYWALNVTEM